MDGSMARLANQHSKDQRLHGQACRHLPLLLHGIAIQHMLRNELIVVKVIQALCSWRNGFWSLRVGSKSQRLAHLSV